MGQDDPQHLRLHGAGHLTDIVNKARILGEAEIILLGYLAIEGAVIQAFQAQAVDRTNLMAQVAECGHQRLWKVLIEADDPGPAGFVEMAADSIADALFEFWEGFGLGEDGLTEGMSLVAPFGRFFHKKDDFIHRLSYYITWGRGGLPTRPLVTHLPARSLMSQSLIVLEAGGQEPPRYPPRQSFDEARAAQPMGQYRREIP